MMQATLDTPPRAHATVRRQNEDVLASTIPTELGWMALAQRDEVLRGIVFGHSSRRQAIDSLNRYLGHGSAASMIFDTVEIDDQPAAIVDVVERLTAYAAGEDVDFSDVRIDQSHLTDFGRRIVLACRRIPRGETRSYGELAAACGSPGAARAVGQVMAKNRYPLIVPCHRVLAASGRLGGFSAPQGLTMKRRLLAIEGQSRLTR